MPGALVFLEQQIADSTAALGANSASGEGFIPS